MTTLPLAEKPMTTATATTAPTAPTAQSVASSRKPAAYALSQVVVDRFIAELSGASGDASGATRERYAAKKKDSGDYRWITVTPPGHDTGRPVMIDKKDGTIKAGMGGKFDGQKIGEIGKGKSGSGSGGSGGSGSKPSHGKTYDVDGEGFSSFLKAVAHAKGKGKNVTLTESGESKWSPAPPVDAKKQKEYEDRKRAYEAQKKLDEQQKAERESKAESPAPATAPATAESKPEAKTEAKPESGKAEAKAEAKYGKDSPVPVYDVSKGDGIYAYMQDKGIRIGKDGRMLQIGGTTRQDRDMHSLLKSIGAKWSPEHNAWRVGYTKDKMEKLQEGLSNRPSPAEQAKKTEALSVSIPYAESSVRMEAKRLGARWNPETKQWIMKSEDDARKIKGMISGSDSRSRSSRTQGSQSAAGNRKGLASPKQINVIRRARDRGEWFDTFDGASGYHPTEGPSDEQISKMTSREASNLIGEIMANRYSPALADRFLEQYRLTSEQPETTCRPVATPGRLPARPGYHPSVLARLAKPQRQSAQQRLPLLS